MIDEDAKLAEKIANLDAEIKLAEEHMAKQKVAHESLLRMHRMLKETMEANQKLPEKQ